MAKHHARPVFPARADSNGQHTAELPGLTGGSALVECLWSAPDFELGGQHAPVCSWNRSLRCLSVSSYLVGRVTLKGHIIRTWHARRIPKSYVLKTDSTNEVPR